MENGQLNCQILSGFFLFVKKHGNRVISLALFSFKNQLCCVSQRAGMVYLLLLMYKKIGISPTREIEALSVVFFRMSLSKVFYGVWCWGHCPNPLERSMKFVANSCEA